MKKLKAIIATLCLVGALGLATPTITKADDQGSGPQGASKSTTPAPPPPAPTVAEFWVLIMAILMWLFG